MAQSAFKGFPNQKSSFKYTTVLGGIKVFKMKKLQLML